MFHLPFLRSALAALAMLWFTPAQAFVVSQQGNVNDFVCATKSCQVDADCSAQGGAPGGLHYGCMPNEHQCGYPNGLPQDATPKVDVCATQGVQTCQQDEECRMPKNVPVTLSGLSYICLSDVHACGWKYKN